MVFGKDIRRLISQFGAKTEATADVFALRLERYRQRDGWRAPPQALFKMRSKPLAAAAR